MQSVFSTPVEFADAAHLTIIRCNIIDNGPRAARACDEGEEMLGN